MTNALKKSIARKCLLLLVAISLITLLPPVYADLGTFKINSCVPIRVLSNCSTVYLTEVTNNNQTFNITQSMTKISGQTFLYSFCNTSLIDIYTFSWNPSCQDCTQVDCGNRFTISSTGSTQSTSQGLGSFGYLILFIFLTIFFSYLGFILSKNDLLWVLGIFFIFLSICFLIYDVWLSNEYYINYIGGQTSNSMPQTFFYIFLCVLVLGLLVAIVLIAGKWKDIYLYILSIFKKKDEYDEDLEHELEDIFR